MAFVVTVFVGHSFSLFWCSSMVADDDVVALSVASDDSEPTDDFDRFKNLSRNLSRRLSLSMDFLKVRTRLPPDVFVLRLLLFVESTGDLEELSDLLTLLLSLLIGLLLFCGVGTIEMFMSNDSTLSDAYALRSFK